ncbi:MAG: hypothetical protein QOI13_1367 [Paraburkholderia sp.]|nr:hypothetical protein [Paraburkholderia sp.]
MNGKWSLIKKPLFWLSIMDGIAPTSNISKAHGAEPVNSRDTVESPPTRLPRHVAGPLAELSERSRLITDRRGAEVSAPPLDPNRTIGRSNSTLAAFSQPMPDDFTSIEDADVLQGVLRALDGMPGLPPERKDALKKSLIELQNDFASAEPRGRTPIYVMEGATGVSHDIGRPSTDPDENMALKAIAFVARQRKEAAVVAVPDAGNEKQTRAFLMSLGARVESLKEGGTPQPGVIYLARLDDAVQMKEVVNQTAKGREVMVLGPPLGYATKLLTENTPVTIMGSAKEVNGKLESLSTNTKVPETAEFVREAIRLNAKQIPSRTMGPLLAIPLAELEQGTSLITEADKLHWASNSTQQFLGVAPHLLMTKRLEQGGARLLFAEDMDPATQSKRSPIDLDPQGKGLVFQPLLSQMAAAEPQADELPRACDELGPGYDFLRSNDGGTTAKKYLRELVGAHRDNRDKFAATRGYDECLETITAMSDKHAIHAFAAIALAFKSIYDEKTMNAWQNSATPGHQWRADEFAKGYVDHPGKQVPYDALVVLGPFIGLLDSSADKAAIANKVLLVFWADLHSSDARAANWGR